jgi:hypothetical protein
LPPINPGITAQKIKTSWAAPLFSSLSFKTLRKSLKPISQGQDLILAAEVMPKFGSQAS